MDQRVKVVAAHLAAPHAPALARGTPQRQCVTAAVGVKSPEDVVIVWYDASAPPSHAPCSALRTPICRAKKGALKDCAPEELLAEVLKAVLARTRIDPRLVADVVVGNVLQMGAGATTARMAALYAGLPETTSAMAVNRQCSSGLQAVATVAAAIAAGYYDVGIGGGVESMTLHYGPQALNTNVSKHVLAHGAAADCLLPMGVTSENVAREFGVSRARQDELARRSHEKAAAAQDQGRFREEIVPVRVQHEDGSVAVVEQDDGIRRDVSTAALAKLRPVFAENGTTTAGNSSQVSDGAAAVLLMRRATAARLALPVLAKLVSYEVVGVPPNVMGIGPAFAIPAALHKAGLAVADIDVFEVNEAFASQAAYCVEKLGIAADRVNPNGGAIALGHPLGCTGARQIATLLPELRRRRARLGVVSMCIGTGMGAAAVIENEVL